MASMNEKEYTNDKHERLQAHVATNSMNMIIQQQHTLPKQCECKDSIDVKLILYSWRTLSHL